MDTQWDVVIVGGGAAGLSAGLMLARAGRRVAVVDGGQPRNRFAAHMHGVLGHEGKAPTELLAEGRRDFEEYGGVVLAQHAESATREGESFVVRTTGGSTLRARRMLVATGLRDDLPDIAGLVENWGKSVVSCPYCDGYEVRDTRIGILATGPASVFQAQLLRQWSHEVTYFVHDAGTPEAEAMTAFEARGIAVEPGRVVRVVTACDDLVGVQLDDCRVVELDAIFTSPGLDAVDELLEELGADFTETPFGRFVITDPSGKTSVEGLWAAGNVANPMANVPASMGAGSVAGGAINADLVLDDVAAAVDSHRQATGATDSETFWENIYRRRSGPSKLTPNAVLERTLEGLVAGTVLDLGCAQGADAIWLAERGWQVTAVDVSQTAVDRARANAEAAGVGAMVTTERHDLSVSFPNGTFGLVSAQYLQSPIEFARVGVLKRAASAVAGGGLLLIVDHASTAPWSWNQDPDAKFPTPEETLATLDLDSAQWLRVTVERVEREASGPQGEIAIVADNVIALRRLR